MVVISSVALTSATRTEHGLKALPLIWLVQALHTSRPQPYFGPVTPSRSRSTHSRRTSSSVSTETCSPLRMKVCLGTGCSFVPYRARVSSSARTWPVITGHDAGVSDSVYEAVGG